LATARCLSFTILLATVTLLVYVSQEPPAAPRPADIIRRWRRITCPIGELSPDLLWDCIAKD